MWRESAGDAPLTDIAPRRRLPAGPFRSSFPAAHACRGSIRAGLADYARWLWMAGTCGPAMTSTDRKLICGARARREAD